MALLERTCELSVIVLTRPSSVVNFFDTVRGREERVQWRERTENAARATNARSVLHSLRRLNKQ